MPEETPEEKAERHLLRIKPYLDYVKQPSYDREFMQRAREKDPFLDWVLKYPDVNPALYFYAMPPPAPQWPEPVTPGPGQPTSPGMTNPGTIRSNNEIYDLLAKMAAKFGVVALLLCILALPAMAQTVDVRITWDASTTDTRDPAAPNPVKYKLYRCTDAAATACQAPTDTGTALEAALSLAGGTFYFYATAYWFAVTGDGQPVGDTTIESGKSNVLRVQVLVPPGNPGNTHVKSVVIAEGNGTAPTLTVRAE